MHETQRVNEVEHGSFTPLVFSSCSGMGPEAAVVIKRLAHSLATKRNAAYPGCSLAAVLLARSAIRCILGSRSVRRRHFDLAPVDLVQGSPGRGSSGSALDCAHSHFTFSSCCTINYQVFNSDTEPMSIIKIEE
eukprot:scpid100633/ scgid4779/ 